MTAKIDSFGNETNYAYDDFNRLIKIEHPCINTPNGPMRPVEQFGYDTLGNCTLSIDANGGATKTIFNILGKPLHITHPDGTISYRYHYNRRDQVVQVEDLVNGTRMERTYDPLGRLSCETLNNGLCVCTLYDSFDRPVHITLPDSTVIEYQYDEHDLRAVRRRILTHRYLAYDLHGNCTQSTFANGMDLFKKYDAMNRLVEQHSPLYHQGIGYDTVGNVTGLGIIDPLGTYLSNFTYDGLYQLASEEGVQNHLYAYDSLHNRIVKDQNACAFNALNQILAQEDIHFEYEPNGNCIRKVENGSESTYTYDALDRLIRTTANGITTTFAYDAFNRRLTKNDLLYIYIGENEVGSFNNSQIQELRILGLGLGAEIGAAVLYELKGQTYIPIHDHNGNVAALFDLNNNSVETYRYTAFGIEETPPSALNPWRFASKRFDAETGFIYFGRRYYDSAIGRWITTDPEGYQEGPNLYAYVRNNPLSRYDLYGLFEEAGWFTSFDDFKSHAWDAGAGVLQWSWERTCNAYESLTHNRTASNLGFNLWDNIDEYPRLLEAERRFYEDNYGNKTLMENLKQEAVDLVELTSFCCGPVSYFVNEAIPFASLGRGALNWGVRTGRTLLLQTEKKVCNISKKVVQEGHHTTKKTYSFASNVLSRNLQTNISLIKKIEQQINGWLGKGTKLIKNSSGDYVFISKDELRRVRFDLKNPSPHNNPHGHIEEYIEGKWNKSGPIYPIDVQHN